MHRLPPRPIVNAGWARALFALVALRASVAVSAPKPAPAEGARASAPRASANLTEAKVEAALARMRELCQKNLRAEVVAQFGDEDIAAWPAAFQDKRAGADKAVEALSLRGTSFAARKDYERAKKDFTLALELSPSNGYMWNSLGDIYRRANDDEKALDAYNKAFEFDRAQHTEKSFGWMPINATLEAASILIGRTDYPEALKVLGRYDDGDIRRMAVYWGCRILRAYGQIYAATGREEEAMANFKAALALERKQGE